jgi:hypothetical protein
MDRPPMTTDQRPHHGYLTARLTTNPLDALGCLRQQADYARMLTSTGAPGWTVPNNLSQSLKIVGPGNGSRGFESHRLRSDQQVCCGSPW